MSDAHGASVSVMNAADSLLFSCCPSKLLIRDAWGTRVLCEKSIGEAHISHLAFSEWIFAASDTQIFCFAPKKPENETREIQACDSFELDEKQTVEVKPVQAERDSDSDSEDKTQVRISQIAIEGHVLYVQFGSNVHYYEFDADKETVTEISQYQKMNDFQATQNYVFGVESQKRNLAGNATEIIK
jgi:hypothetical protein